MTTNAHWPGPGCLGRLPGGYVFQIGELLEKSASPIGGKVDPVSWAACAGGLGRRDVKGPGLGIVYLSNQQSPSPCFRVKGHGEYGVIDSLLNFGIDCKPCQIPVLWGNSRMKITAHPREDPGTAVISSMGDTAGVSRAPPSSINNNKQNDMDQRGRK